MKIISWNVAGLRARIKNNQFQKFIDENEFDIICIQETKASSKDIKIEEKYDLLFPYKIWNVNTGKSQRKGFSGTSIWSKIKFNEMRCPDFDEEGRTCVIEFEDFILLNVYTPNSQGPDTERSEFRKTWDKNMMEYISKLQLIKPVIFCGDFNVAHNNIDINNPKKKKNIVAGFLDFERENFNLYLENLNFIDIFRFLNKEKVYYSYWSNFVKQRNNKNGWRIDYFLIPNNFISRIIKIDYLINTDGSDHCPVVLDIKS